MTREDEIEARLEKARLRPWKVKNLVRIIGSQDRDIGRCNFSIDAEFIAHAPDDIRYLLDRVVELEDDLDDYVAQVDHLTGAHDD